MKKFAYRMENILSIQYKLEEQAKMILGEAMRKLAIEEEILGDFFAQKEGYERKARKLVEDKLDIFAIRECKTAIDVMKTRIRSQMIEVHVAEKNVNEARRKLQETMITRKSHEILKEKGFETYKKELEDEESKAIDELVSYTHTAKQIR